MNRFDVKNIKQRKTTKVIKLRWSAWIWRQNEQKCWVTSQTIQNNANLQKYSNYNELHRFDVKNIKQRKTTKVIKLRWSAWIWRQNEQKCWVTSQTIQNNSKTTKVSNYNELHRFDVKTTKMLSYVPNHSKHSKTTKVIKLRWSASIWRQNEQKCWVTSQTIQNNANLQKLSKYNELHRFDVKNIKPFHTAKLQKWSNYDELHRFDVKTIKNVELRPKPFKTTQTYKSIQITMNCIDLMSKHQTTQNYKSDQITMKCMDLTSKRTKMLSYVANHSKQRKSTKVIKVQWIASIWCQKHQTTQNYKSDQITMNCIDLTSKRSKMLSYVPNHSKQRKPTKVIKLQWIASIWCQKHQTTQNYKSDQITMNCIDLTSKRTKMLSYVPNHSKQRKTTKVIKLRWIASIWRQNDKKCWVTSQTIPNNAKLQKWSNYDELHRFDVKTNKNVELRPKPFKTTQNYKSDQITMNCIDLTSKRKKCWVTSQTIQNNAKLQKWSNYDELHRFDVKTIQKCWVTSQTIQNNANLQKLSNYNELHRFDVKNIKQRKTTKVIKLRWIASIWRQNDKKCWVTSQTIPNTAKLQKWSNYDELHRFDVKTIKMLSYVPNHSKHSKTTKVIKLRWIASIWRQNDKKCWVTSQTIPNTAKLQKWSNYDELHRFDVKTNKNVELRPKPFKTTQNYKSDQITMNCIDLTSKR